MKRHGRPQLRRFPTLPSRQFFAEKPALVGLCIALPAMLLFIVCALRADFANAPVSGDQSLSIYIAQTMIRGNGPYQQYYILVPPLAHMLDALAIVIGRAVGLSDVLAIRYMMLLMVLSLFWLVYLLAWNLWHDWRIGAVAVALTGWNALINPQVGTATPTKLIAMFFIVLMVLAAQRRRWFWSGASGMCAALAWPTATVFLPIPIFAALWQHTPDQRVHPALKAAAGAVAALVLLMVYMLIKGTAHLFWQEYVGGLMLTVTNKVVAAQSSTEYSAAEGGLGGLLRLLSNAIRIGDQVVLMVGFVGAAAYAVQIIRQSGGLFKVLRNADAVVSLLVFAMFWAASIFDFQQALDLVPIIPHLTLFAAWAIITGLDGWMQRRSIATPRRSTFGYAATIVIAILLIRVGAVKADDEFTLTDQQNLQWWADTTLEDRRSVQALGYLDLLIFHNRINHTRAIALDFKPRMAMLGAGVSMDDLIEELDQSKPDLIYLNQFQAGVVTRELDSIRSWLEQHYLVMRSARGAPYKIALYIKPDDPQLLRAAAGFTYISHYPMLMQAELRAQDGDLVGAHALLEEAAANGSDDTLPHLLWGNFQRTYGESQAALAGEAYQQASESNPVGLLALGGYQIEQDVSAAQNSYFLATNRVHSRNLISANAAMRVLSPLDLLHIEHDSALALSPSLFLMGYDLPASAQREQPFRLTLYLWDFADMEPMQEAHLQIAWLAEDGSVRGAVTEHYIAWLPTVGAAWDYTLTLPADAVAGETLQLQITLIQHDQPLAEPAVVTELEVED